MSNTTARKICGAKKRNGEPCHGSPMANGRCRLHGGLTPSGVAASRFKTGKYSKVMPTRLIERYEEGVSDPELLALRKEIALCDARIEDLLARVDTGEAGALWKTLRATYKDMEKAQRSGDIAAGSEALVQIGVLINRGLADYAAWDDLGEWMEKRRKLAETEAKRLVAMEQMVTAEEAATMLAAMLALIHQEVKKQIASGNLALPAARQLLMGVSDGVRDLASREAQAALPPPETVEIIPA